VKSGMQRPPEWLWRALGIVRGLNPSALELDMVPVVETIQGGWGLATYEQIIRNVAVGVPEVVTLDSAVDEVTAVRVSATNAGTANMLLSIRHGIESLVPLTEYIGNVAPGTSQSWMSLNPHQPWLKGLPGGRMEITIGGATTNPGVLTVLVARLPAGTNLS